MLVQTSQSKQLSEFIYVCDLQALTAQTEQLQEEQQAERRRSKEEAQQWHREKVGQEPGRLPVN